MKVIWEREILKNNLQIVYHPNLDLILLLVRMLTFTRVHKETLCLIHIPHPSV